MNAPHSVSDDLRVLAEQAGAGPTDLAARVNRRYRRRRRTRVGGLLTAIVAAGVVALLAAPSVLPAIGSGGQHAAEPAWVPSGPGIWKVPGASAAALPPLAQTWPAAVVTLPPQTPDGGFPVALASAGAGRVLVASQSAPDTVGSLDIYDPATRVYRQLATVEGTTAGGWVHWAVSANRVYWGVDAADGFDVFTVPLAGGAPQHLAHVPIGVFQPGDHLPLNGSHAGPWFATDTAVYWSGAQPGVVRLAATGGAPQPVPGFEDMYLLHGTSSWAARISGGDASPYIYGADPAETLAHAGVTTRLKNLLTGATVDVTAPDRTTALVCAPTVCVGLVVPAADASASASPADAAPTDGATTGGAPVGDGPTGVQASSWRPSEGPVTAFIQRPDGSDRARLPGSTDSNDIYNIVPVGDRALLVTSWITPATGGHDGGVGWMVCDPFSGTAGVAGPGGAQTLGNDGVLGYPVGANDRIDQFFVWGNTH